VAKKRYTPDTIIRKLREAEVLQGQSVGESQAIYEPTTWIGSIH